MARLSLLGTKQRFEAIAEKMWALTATLDDLATRQPTENDKENVSRQLEDISYLVANFSEDFTDEKVSSKSSDYQSSDAEKLRQKFGVDVSDKTFAEAAASIKERLDHRIKNAGISPS